MDMRFPGWPGARAEATRSTPARRRSPSPFDLGRRLGQKAKHGVTGDGLAGTGFPHDSNDFLFVDGEAGRRPPPGSCLLGYENKFSDSLRRASSSVFGGLYAEGVPKPVAEKIKGKEGE